MHALHSHSQQVKKKNYEYSILCFMPSRMGKSVRPEKSEPADTVISRI